MNNQMNVNFYDVMKNWISYWMYIHVHMYIISQKLEMLRMNFQEFTIVSYKTGACTSNIYQQRNGIVKFHYSISKSNATSINI